MDVILAIRHSDFVISRKRSFASGFFNRNSRPIGWHLIRWERLDVHLKQTFKRTSEICAVATASIDDHSDRSNDSAVTPHDVDRFLYSTTTGNDVFCHNKTLAGINFKTPPQNQATLIFFDKDMSLA